MSEIKIKIGDEERAFDGDVHWIHEQIDGRRNKGANACVMVTIKCGQIDMILTTPGCAGHGGGGRRPNRDEQQIFDRWNELKLNTMQFTSGNLVAFLKGILNLCR